MALFLLSKSSQQKQVAKQAATFRLDGPFECQEVPNKSGQDQTSKLPETLDQHCGH